MAYGSLGNPIVSFRCRRQASSFVKIITDLFTRWATRLDGRQTWTGWVATLSDEDRLYTKYVSLYHNNYEIRSSNLISDPSELKGT